MKNKIAIITITGNDNYGNRLQNYALQEVLKSKGYIVETIWREKEYKKNILLKLYYLKEKIFRIIESLKTKKNILRLHNYRQNKFKKFMKFINLSDFESNGIIPKKINDKYDYFVAGSDQIWNYNFADMNENNFLKFADKKKNIAYAASFGIEEINRKWEKYYKENLNNINHISVREIAGKKIVKHLIDKDVPVVLDPTLLLKKENWNFVCKEVKLDVPKNYLLVYFLGNIENVIKEEIIRFAESKKLEIVCLKGWNHDYYYKCGPAEFVYLFKNANYIITDSFHGTAFSIIYEKDFNVFNRKTKASMNSRLESILYLLGLEERYVTNLENMDVIKYNDVNKKLNKLILESNNFLNDSLKD